jgi:hypothetical protein
VNVQQRSVLRRMQRATNRKPHLSGQLSIPVKVHCTVTKGANWTRRRGSGGGAKSLQRAAMLDAVERGCGSCNEAAMAAARSGSSSTAGAFAVDALRSSEDVLRRRGCGKRNITVLASFARTAA